MKIDRLISIIMVLLERKKISAKRLAEMFEVTTRTIYRDIETLNMAGIPIVTYPGANGGIGIMEEYKVDKKLFTTSDITTLLMGLGSITSTLSSEEIVNTIAKVKGLVPAEKVREIELKSSQISIDLTPWAGINNLQPRLEMIKTAMNEGRVLSFMYYGLKNSKSRREVEPHRLVLKAGKWYLQGYCRSRQDFRLFKLSRISSLEVLEEEFTPRDFDTKTLASPEWVNSIDKRVVKVKLLVDEDLRDIMMECCGEENIEECEGNKLIAYFPFIENDQGYSFLLSFGSKCECLEPLHVREELIRRIKALLSVYH